MGGKKKDNRVTPVQNFISGGIAGVASRTITSPLDVVKILAQVGAPETQEGFLKTFPNLYAKEGISAFWKGNGIACLRLFPYNAVVFTSFSQVKGILADEKGQLSVLNSAIGGGLSGTIATIVTYPTDMVKTRLTVQHSPGSDPSKATYKGIVDCFRKIYVEEGPRAFYKGMSTSILGVIPFEGGTFMAYEGLNRVWNKPREKLGPIENFINGCLAGAVAQTVSFPFDTVRKKLQAQVDKKAAVRYNGMTDCFVQTVQKDGIFGLWRGTTANLAKVVPYSGLRFLVLEQCFRVCLYMNGYTVSPFTSIPKPGVDQSLSPSELKKRQ